MVVGRSIIARYVWFMVCLGMLLYMTIEFLRSASKDPFGTSVKTSPFEPAAFSKMMLAEERIGDVFFRGFTLRYHYLNKKSVGLNDTLYKKYMTKSRRYLQNMTTLSKHAGKVFRIWGQDGRRVMPEPAFLHEHMCFAQEPKAGKKLEHVNEQLYASGSPIYHFKMMTDKLKFEIGLYTPLHVHELLSEHFYGTEVEDPVGGFYSIFLNAGITKYVYVDGCQQYKNEELLLPVSYASDACKAECVVEAIGKTLNCTPLTKYLDGDRSKKPCHTFKLPRKFGQDHLELNGKTLRTYENNRLACEAERKCAEQMYCVGWKITLEEMKKPIHQKRPGMNVIHVSVKINFHPTITLVEQFRLYTLECAFASVGGLVGIWLGLSIYDMVKTFCSYMAGRIKRCSASENENNMDHLAN